MKNIFCLLLSMIAFTSCYTPFLSGNPAAVSAGASIGGMLGSIVGDRAGGWQGSQFGALVGTVAGAAVGNAVTTPSTKLISVVAWVMRPLSPTAFASSRSSVN